MESLSTMVDGSCSYFRGANLLSRGRRYTDLILMMAVFSLGWSGQVNAQSTGWSSDSSVNNAVCTATGEQHSLQVASDKDGCSYMAWVDLGSGTKVHVQKFDAMGVPQWQTNGFPVSTIADIYEAPQLVADGSGGVIVTWSEKRPGGNFNIFAQWIDAEETKRWGAEGTPVCTYAGDQKEPQVVLDSSGDVVVTWTDGRIISTDIYGQRIKTDGTAAWTENGEAVCTAAGMQRSPKILTGADGGYIIAWEDNRNGSYDIYAQAVSSAGVSLWDNDVVISEQTNNETSMQAISDGAGGAYIVWEDQRFGTTNLNIYTQRVNSSGELLFTSGGVAICTAPGNQLVPQLATDGAGGAFFTWDDYRNSNYDVYAQRVTNTGTATWGQDGKAICKVADTQARAQVISDLSGGAIFAWFDRGHSGNYDIYAQRLNALGVPQWGDHGQIVSNATRDQMNPIITGTPSGGAVIAWEDFRVGSGTINKNLYASRISSGGVLGPPVFPAAPSDLAVAADSDSLNLTWTDNATNESGYRVKRWVNNGAAEILASLPAGATSFSDSAINICSTFKYQVVAFNGDGEAVSAIVGFDNGQTPSITVNGDNPATVVFGQTYIDAGATAADACGTELVPTVTGVDGVDENNVGSYTITYSVTDANGKTNSESRTVNVVKADQTITFGELPGATYGVSPITLTATSTSGLPVSYSVSGPASIDGAQLTITGAGEVTVTASQQGNEGYNAASEVVRTFTVAKANANISVVGFAGAYDGLPHGATGSAMGVEETPADLAHLLSLGESFTLPPGGTANWTFAGNENYNAASGSVTITITTEGMIRPTRPVRP